jgi:short-subunit dehydrogenase
VLIVGATSAIAEAVARIFAVRKDALYLVGRRADALEAMAEDLRIRGARDVGIDTLDGNDVAAQEDVVQRAVQFLHGLDTVLIAYGTLSDQKACERSAALTAQELAVNAVSIAALLTRLAPILEARKAGAIAVISSVAGDRGRQSNYVYGSAKALLSAFMSGLRQRLYKSGVAVITIKPGFVDTPMTAAFRKGRLWAEPQAVARGIVRAIDRGTPVAYLPGFWYPIMLMIRAIPERLFRKLSL